MKTFDKFRQGKRLHLWMITVFSLIFFSACTSKAERCLNKGITQVEKGKFENGDHYFTESIHCDSVNPRAFYNRALVRKKMCRYTEALTDLDKVLELDSLYLQAYLTRGEIKGMLQDYFGSLDDYRHGLDIYTRNGFQNPSDFHLYPRNTNDLIQIQNQYSQAILKSGKQKYASRDYIGATADFNMATLLEGDNSDAYYLCGNAQFLLHDFEGAIAYYTKVITLEPDQPDAYFARGYAKEKLGQAMSASKDYRKARVLNKLTYLPKRTK